MRRRVAAQLARVPVYAWIVGGAVLVLVLIGYPFGVTLWDWAKLLLVPAVIAAGGLWFSSQQAKQAQELEEKRAQGVALQAYLDQMSQLLIEKNLHNAAQGDAVRTLARARTLAILPLFE
jgi:hypothetical protein